MSGPYYDRYGNEVWPGSSQRQGRYRPPPPQPQTRARIFREEEEVYYEPEPPRQHHHHASPPPPAQIIINNDNFMDDRDVNERPQQARRPQRNEQAQGSNAQSVYIQEQQIVKVRSKSPELSYETRRALEELERLKKDKEHDELVRKMQQELKLKEAKAHEEEEKRKEEEKKMKEKAIEEWKAAEEKKKREAKEKEEEKERIGKEYMRQQLRKDGYTEEEIDALMSKKEKKRDHSPAVSSTQIVIANRPTYLKVHKEHIDPQTLDYYKIKWKWADGEYIYIMETISESEQDGLFEHTRKLREKKLIEFAKVEISSSNKVQRDRQGRLLMVRKKEDKRQRSKSPAVVKRFYLDS